MRCEIHFRLRRGNGVWVFSYRERTYELVEDPISADLGVRHAWLIFLVAPIKVDTPLYIAGERHHLSLRDAKHALARHVASPEPDLF